MKEVLLYKAKDSIEASMVLEILEKNGVKARLGSESDRAGIFAIPYSSANIFVLEKDFEKAREILEDFINE